MSSFLRLPNPLPDTKDKKRARDTMKEYAIVPYLGSYDVTSHSVLTAIYDFVRKSITYRAVVKDIKTYAFGHGLYLVRRSVNGLLIPTIDEDTELQVLDNSVEVGQALEELGMPIPKIVSDSKKLFESYQASGNLYYRIKVVNTAGQWKVYASVVPYRNIMYKERKSTADQLVFYISENLTDSAYLKKNPPEEIYASTIDAEWQWTEKGNGIFETVLHYRNELGDSDYYGESELLCAFERLFVEITEDSNACKVSATELMAKILLMVEAPDKAGYQESSGDGENDTMPDAYENLLYTIRDMTTAAGSGKKTSSVGVVEYPRGLKEPKEIKLEINRDTAYSKHQIETSERRITALLNWSVELTGLKQANATLGGNLISDLFTIKNVSTIEPIQYTFENIFGSVLNQLFTIIGRPDMASVGIKYPGQIMQLVGKLSKGSVQSRAENSNNGNAVEQ